MDILVSTEMIKFLKKLKYSESHAYKLAQGEIMYYDVTILRFV